MALTARISVDADCIIKELVESTGRTKVEIIEAALKSYRFHERMRLLHVEYERLHQNKKAWAEALEENKDLEGTLLDGLEDY